MAEFTLPKNSKIEKGEHFSADESAENIMIFSADSSALKCSPFSIFEFLGSVNSAMITPLVNSCLERY